MNRPEGFCEAALWEWHDGTFDRVRFQRTVLGWDVTGRHGETRYVITLDRDFEPHSLEASCGDHTLTLRRRPDGWRDEDNGLIPGSIKARDLDLGWTAVTNSFPIRRLIDRRRSHGTFDVLMISQPDLATRIVRQSYDFDGTFWTYTNHDNGFSARLTVDNDGLVADYPDLCIRKD